MTATVAESHDATDSPGPDRAAFIDALVARLHAQYGVDPQAVRTLATEVLASFADARVQAFVPILVEKRVREAYRQVSSLPELTVLPAASPA